MVKQSIQLVLTIQKNINGKEKKPGDILLEGICPKGIEVDDVNKAIQLRHVKVIAKSVESEEGTQEAESQGKK